VNAPAPACPTDHPPLRLGEAAPDFTARSTRGPISLSGFRGRWLLFFSHPADFTPVCTSEFVAFAQAASRFEALGCALLGLSVDSLFSHLAWVRLIHDRFGVVVSFPVIEDPTMEVARAYGMVARDATDAAAVRTSMILDPEGILRASLTYPAEIGRSIPELLRTVQALQRVSAGGVLAPADWEPGRPMLRTPPQDATEVLGGGPADWFYASLEDPGPA